MANQYKYTMLMASLPAPGKLFSEKQTPLSRLRLEERLKALDEPDRAVLNVIEQALDWSRMEDSANETAVFASVRKAIALTNSVTLRGIVERRMEIRTCLAALRRRAAGGAQPPTDGSWGYGRWRRRLAQNWRATSFGLERVFPWIKDADRLLVDGKTYNLDRLILDIVDRDLRRRGALHQFDLEAVVIYVLRWSLFDRWGRYNAEAATRRFSQLIDDGLRTAEATGAIAPQRMEISQ